MVELALAMRFFPFTRLELKTLLKEIRHVQQQPTARWYTPLLYEIEATRLQVIKIEKTQLKILAKFVH